ncbi:MAG: homocysteine S-methyltransferase [Verrucomicrobia bacterium]|nr:MAG: homocysteine S-methyltransferase [Verrucomicrobiota bacterium]RKZ10961.1 MAG: homocysteine S-methyltransferase [bacterium]
MSASAGKVQEMAILLDGGMGYELKLRGVNIPSHLDSIWSAQALIDDPDAVVSVHADYIDVGVDVLTINNYAVTPQLLGRVGMAERVEELTRKAVDLAEMACKKAARRPKLAASFPPLETSYRADLTKGREETCEGYRRIAAALSDRVDLIICETMASSQEALWAATVASESGLDYWVSWTLQGDRPNTLPSGESLEDAIGALGDLRPSACLVNCCGANFITAAIPQLVELTDCPIGGYANAEMVTPGKDHSEPDPEAESRQHACASALDPTGYAVQARRWLDAGASIVGGCCGTRPEHIRQLRTLLGSSRS